MNEVQLKEHKAQLALNQQGRWRMANPEKYREYQRRYRKEHPELSEKQKPYIKKWVQKNKEHLQEYRRRYYYENRDVILAKQRERTRQRREERQKIKVRALNKKKKSTRI
ncbi:hypothetical protein [Treponema sp. R6D11]